MNWHRHWEEFGSFLRKRTSGSHAAQRSQFRAFISDNCKLTSTQKPPTRVGSWDAGAQSPKVRTFQVSLHTWVVTQTGIHPDRGILLSKEKEPTQYTASWSNLVELWKANSTNPRLLTTMKFHLFYITRQFLQRKGLRNEELISGTGLGAGNGTWVGSGCCYRRTTRGSRGNETHQS